MTLELPQKSLRYMVVAYLLILGVLPALATPYTYNRLYSAKFTGGLYGGSAGTNPYYMERCEQLHQNYVARLAQLVITVIVVLLMAFSSISLIFFIGTWRRLVAYAIRLLPLLAIGTIISNWMTRVSLSLPMQLAAIPILMFAILLSELIYRAYRLAASTTPGTDYPIKVEWKNVRRYMIAVLVAVAVAGTANIFYFGRIVINRMPITGTLVILNIVLMLGIILPVAFPEGVHYTPSKLCYAFIVTNVLFMLALIRKILMLEFVTGALYSINAAIFNGNWILAILFSVFGTLLIVFPVYAIIWVLRHRKAQQAARG